MAVASVLPLVAAAPADVQFADVTRAAGVDFLHQSSATSNKYLIETMGGGVALVDYDNDGRLDIFFTNGAKIDDPMPEGTAPDKSEPKYWNRLYHQQPDGTFVDVTERAGLTGMPQNRYGMGVAVGDFDNDGFEDLYVTGYGGNTLYHNNGNGTFTDVTAHAGVGAGGWSASAGFLRLRQRRHASTCSSRATWTGRSRRIATAARRSPAIARTAIPTTTPA